MFSLSASIKRVFGSWKKLRFKSSLAVSKEKEARLNPLIDIMMDLTVALTNNNEEDALAAADRFYQSVCSSQNISSSQVRDLYFKYPEQKEMEPHNSDGDIL